MSPTPPSIFFPSIFSPFHGILKGIFFFKFGIFFFKFGPVVVHGEQHQHGLAVGVDEGGGVCDADGWMAGGEDGWVVGRFQT